MKTWFTSDFHFGHFNIIEYCNRPFKDVEHMNRELIRRHNERVKPEDTVYFLGDFCFKNTSGGKSGEGMTHPAEYYMDQLNGNFVCIRGNHDNNNSLNTKLKHAVIELGGRDIYLVHRPEEACRDYELNLVGHVHGAWKSQLLNGWNGSTMVNVGVDVWDYYPISIQEIFAYLEKTKRAVPVETVKI